MLVLALPTARADVAKPPIIHVRGETHVTMKWQRDTPAGADVPWLRLEGQALDDADRPLGGATVTVNLQALDGAAAPDLSRGLTCADAALARSPGAAGLMVPTDSDGRFCLRLPVAIARYHLRAEAPWQPAQFDAAALEQELDFGKSPLSLWLEGSDGKADLGRPESVLSARVGYDDQGRLVYASGLAVSWLDEKGVTLATATSEAEGHVHFRVETAKLGDPGLARHRLTCPGSDAVGSAATSFPLEKRARIELVPVSAPTDVLTGTELPYAFRARLAVPGRDLFATGAIVQASFGGQLVGASEADAQGNVVVPVLLAGAGQSGLLEFRATAPVPFLVPSEPLRIPVEVTAPRSWRSVWLLAGFLALVLWLALGRAPRARPRALAKLQDARAPVAPPPRAEVVVTAEAATPRWHGNVKDAHDRSPLAGARVDLIRPGFSVVQVLGGADADREGSFVLDGEARRPGDRLRIQAPLHRTLEVDAPSFGTITVTAISRRRGLLHDFARWAQARAWAPSLRRKPTPLDVAQREEGHAAWAARVDTVVFGPGEVDAAREASAEVPGESS